MNLGVTILIASSNTGLTGGKHRSLGTVPRFLLCLDVDLNVGTVGCDIGFTAQSLSHGQYRLFWSAGKCNRNLRLAPEDLHRSANVNAILQRTVASRQEVMHSMSSDGLVLNVFQGARRMRLVRLGRDHAPPHSPVLQKPGKAA